METLEETVTRFGREVFVYTQQVGGLAFAFELDKEALAEAGRDARELGRHLAAHHPEKKAVEALGGGGRWGWSGGEYVYRVW